VKTYLDAILAFHRERARVDTRSFQDVFHLASQVSPCRGFAQAIAQESNSRLAVIAEIKRRSPSKGNLNIDVDPAVLAQQYESGGATCLSVLTDVEHFAGSAQDLKVAHRSVGLPILRKDFTVDVRDVCDARLMGADAVLLIAAALSASEMVSFHEVATSLGLDVLVEVHDERELEVALKANATMIGVNQRDLVTFQVDHERAVRMGGVIPAGVVRVAESGVRGPDDAQSLRNAGYDAVLVGESLVTASNPAESLRLLRCA
jgi:indole-3-glycerol phosphate synthase